MWVEQKIRWGLIQKHLPPPPGTIFEVGCGNGAFLGHLKRKGYQVEGCEMNLNGIPCESDIFPHVVAASGLNIPKPDNTYDCTISSDVLEHVYPQDREKFLRESLRITKPNGLLVLTVWTTPNWSFRLLGAALLCRTGQLPQWYLEHITIAPPVIQSTVRAIEAEAELLLCQPYQRFLSHLGTAIQQTLVRHHSLPCRAITRLSGLIHTLDFVGQAGSLLLVARKRASPPNCT